MTEPITHEVSYPNGLEIQDVWIFGDGWEVMKITCRHDGEFTVLENRPAKNFREIHYLRQEIYGEKKPVYREENESVKEQKQLEEKEKNTLFVQEDDKWGPWE